MLVRHTEGSDSGYWPTPTQDVSNRKKKYAQGGTPLTMAIHMWPTPTVGVTEGGEQSDRVEKTKSGGYILRKKNKPDNTFGAKLSDAVLFEEKKMWPTPAAFDAVQMKLDETPEHWKEQRDKHKKKGQNKHFPLTVAVKMRPTPTVQDSPQVTGQLNPSPFVEWLMGWPIGWTCSRPLEMARYLEWLQQHGEF
tara:strand:- start:205 stop:783 length:579 start_codon:yes stop_codon:yes gene_type:complete